MKVALTYLQEVFVTVDLDEKQILSVHTEGGGLIHQPHSAVEASGNYDQPVTDEQMQAAYHIAETADWPVWDR